MHPVCKDHFYTDSYRFYTGTAGDGIAIAPEVVLDFSMITR